MHVFLWVLQGALAAMFALAGLMKSTQPKEQLVERLPWVEDVSVPTLRLIGVVELLAAIGLVVPPLVDVATVLTPLAAAGLVVHMLLAMNTHRRRREPGAIAFNAALLVAAAIVAWGRFGPYGF